MWRLRLRRWRWRRRGAIDPELLSAWHADLPSGAAPLEDVCFLVCDAEMSGLDADVADLLSLGWVKVRAGELCLDSAAHHLIRSQSGVGQSAIVHGLRDCELSNANTLKSALQALLAAAQGCVLVFHNASLDMAFLDRASKRVFGAPLLLPVADTMLLEQRLLQRHTGVMGQCDLRLQACRSRYGLEPFKGHNALADAVATAELLLAHSAGRGGDLRLRDLL